MAEDFGDYSGEKLFDWMLRIGQEAGAEAMARSARELSERLAGIRGTIAGGRAEAIEAEGVPTYAKLSLEELSGLPEYATIKEVVSDKLRAASVEHHIIPGGNRGVGREPDPRPGGRHGGAPRGTRILNGGASPVRGDRLRVRGAPRLGALPGVQRGPARRRGAR